MGFAKRVDDPDVEAGKRRHAFTRNAFDIGRVGDVAKSKAQGRDVSVVLEDWQHLDRATLPLDRNPLARREAFLMGDGWVLAAPAGVVKQ